MTEQACPKCGGVGVSGARVGLVGDANGYPILEVEGGGGLIAKKHEFLLSARACFGCGFTEIYVDEPDELRKVVQGS